jgi:two-component system sensor histidine kinase/response regulator
LQTDEGKLRQVLINLLSNAIKFTEQGGVILRVRTNPRQWPTNPNLTRPFSLTFEVEDTGPGIDDKEIDQLFAPFGQTETGRNSQQGTGLGLPISQKFVQLMGGEIQVKTVLGKGSVFSFDIQVNLADKNLIASPYPTAKVIGLEPDQQTYRILAVDDRLESRLLLVKLLGDIGFDVREASNGQEAIAVWESWQPHLIWMDMRMPVMDGYEATKRIKSTLQGQATVIIALTASAFEEDRHLVLSAGCNDFLRKPFREEVLWEKMAHHLGVRYLYGEMVDPPSTDNIPLFSSNQLIEELQIIKYKQVGRLHNSLEFQREYEF